MEILQFKWYYMLYYYILRFFHCKLLMSRDGLLAIHVHKAEMQTNMFSENRDLQRVLSEIRESPAILMLNAHALNITLNWLCNVMNFSNVHQRIVIFAFDRTTYDTIRISWPGVKVILWPLPTMHERFATGDGQYQMFQYFRAKLCMYLASIGRDFWMIQSDTYWRKNLFEIVDTDGLLGQDGNLLFDREGTEGLLAEMIAGGNYFVRADQRSECFFKELSSHLENYYATDNNIMGALCARHYCSNKCAFIPYRFVSNWRWHWGTKEYIPALLQFDGGSSSNAKFVKMQTLGAKFVDLTPVFKHYPAKCRIRESAAPESAIPKWRLKAEGNDITRLQRLIAFVHPICEWLYGKFPRIDFILRVYIFPYYAYYIVP